MMCGVTKGGSTEQRLEASFELFDANGDGVVSKDEVRAMLIMLMQQKVAMARFQTTGRRTAASAVVLDDKTLSAIDGIVKTTFEKVDTDKVCAPAHERTASFWLLRAGTKQNINPNRAAPSTRKSSSAAFRSTQTSAASSSSSERPRVFLLSTFQALFKAHNTLLFHLPHSSTHSTTHRVRNKQGPLPTFAAVLRDVEEANTKADNTQSVKRKKGTRRGVIDRTRTVFAPLRSLHGTSPPAR